MKFSVEVLRVRYDSVRVEVEADNYSQASTFALELAKGMESEKFTPNPYRKTELRVTSTDRRDNECPNCLKTVPERLKHYDDNLGCWQCKKA